MRIFQGAGTSPTPQTQPHPIPRLLIEILEHIVDCIALDFDPIDCPGYWTSRDVNLMLAACSLVYRALVPRCRLFLFKDVILRFPRNLTNLVLTLQKYPYLIEHIWILDIHPTDTESQSWVTTVLLSLPITSMNLRALILSGVDFTQLHSTFYMTCTRFQETESLFLDGVRFTRSRLRTRGMYRNNVSAALVYVHASPRCLLTAFY